jgi:hypothetical protein
MSCDARVRVSLIAMHDHPSQNMLLCLFVVPTASPVTGRLQCLIAWKLLSYMSLCDTVTNESNCEKKKKY